MNNLNIKKTGNVLGIISAVFFLICLAWGVVISDPILNELHSNLLRVVYPGSGVSFIGLLVGVVEGFAYGWIFGVSFAWLCKKVCISENK